MEFIRTKGKASEIGRMTSVSSNMQANLIRITCQRAVQDLSHPPLHSNDDLQQAKSYPNLPNICIYYEIKNIVDISWRTQP